jgi:hypothetical protein
MLLASILKAKKGAVGDRCKSLQLQHVTLMWEMNLPIRLHDVTFKMTVTFTFTAVKTSNITLMIFGAEYEIINLPISVTIPNKPFGI